MADVLGKYSFLDTPDVNGINILLAGDAAGAVTGVVNQISVTGTIGSPVIGLANNSIIPGTASLTLPVGTTAQRPISPLAGMARFNSTLTTPEHYDGITWLPGGKLIQMVTGTITQTSSNVQIPYDNTPPTSTEGLQLWSQSFTPLRADSTIIITSNIFFAVASTGSVFVSGAYFSGNTNIYSSCLGQTVTTNGAARSATLMATVSATDTNTRVYSFRAGPGSAVTVFYMQGTAGQGYGSTTNSGRYIIQEIAP